VCVKALTGCDAVMIGRAAIGNPWIFQRKDFNDVTFAERTALIRQHLDAMIDYYGPRLGIVLFRKHVVRYIRGVPYATDVRLALLTCTTADEFVDLFSQWEERYERGEYHGTAEDIALFEEFESCVTEPAS
jgi:tRNA-dihydrouridine synthase